MKENLVPNISPAHLLSMDPETYLIELALTLLDLDSFFKNAIHWVGNGSWQIYSVGNTIVSTNLRKHFL